METCIIKIIKNSTSKLKIIISTCVIKDIYSKLKNCNVFVKSIRLYPQGI